jgi:hypothetical protein
VVIPSIVKTCQTAISATVLVLPMAAIIKTEAGGLQPKVKAGYLRVAANRFSAVKETAGVSDGLINHRLDGVNQPGAL